jgi:hypothetical protein
MVIGSLASTFLGWLHSSGKRARRTAAGQRLTASSPTGAGGFAAGRSPRAVLLRLSHGPARTGTSARSDATIRHLDREERLGDPRRYASFYGFIRCRRAGQVALRRSLARETSHWKDQELAPFPTCTLLGRNGRTTGGVPQRGIACR